MKRIVIDEPDAVSLVLADLESADFEVDPQTYYYFRDEIFMKEVKAFIEETFPGELREPKEFEDPDSVEAGADQVQAFLDNGRVITKRYPAFQSVRDHFYEYKGDIYGYELVRMADLLNPISLVRYETEDVVRLLNSSRRWWHQSLLRRILYLFRNR